MNRTLVPGIDVPSVSQWLTRRVEGAEPPFEFAAFTGGRSNLTYRVEGANGARFVLRRPPLGPVLPTAHDMEREHRIVASVGAAGIPVPRALGMCTDPDVTGAPFYVVSAVDGVVLDGRDAASTLSVPVRRAAAEHLIDVLADLHRVDVDGVGLGDLSRRGGYLERQLVRWTRQFESSTLQSSAIDTVGRLLRARVPAEETTALVHGDYRFGNVIIDPASGSVAAVLDWELSTLGDPLADIGYLAVFWSDGRERALREDDPTAAGGFPPFHDVLVRYEQRARRDAGAIDFYVAFAAWRMAIIGAGVYDRHRSGAFGGGPPNDAELASYRADIDRLAEHALSSARRLR